MPKKAARGGKQKTSLMEVNFSRAKKVDMSKTLPSKDLDGVAEYLSLLLNSIQC